MEPVRIHVETTDRYLVDVPEACRLLSLSRPTLYRLFERGALHPVHVGSKVLIPTSDIERWVESLSEERDR